MVMGRILHGHGKICTVVTVSVITKWTILSPAVTTGESDLLVVCVCAYLVAIVFKMTVAGAWFETVVAGAWLVYVTGVWFETSVAGAWLEMAVAWAWLEMAVARTWLEMAFSCVDLATCVTWTVGSCDPSELDWAITGRPMPVFVASILLVYPLRPGVIRRNWDCHGGWRGGGS